MLLTGGTQAGTMISHRHKFIFLHIPKCAGSTLNKAFSKHSDDPEFDNWHPKFDEYCRKYKEAPSYTTIISTRNPWDRLVSSFYFLKKGGNQSFHDIQLSKTLCIYKNNFTEWVRNDFKKMINLDLKVNHLKPISFYISKYHIDYSIKLENLQQDFNTVCDKIGIPRQQLPHTNKTEHKHYTEYYDDETREIVAKKYAKDIEYFGYEFE